MMIRTTLHLVGTSCAFIAAYALVPRGEMWVQMAAYGATWTACAVAYLGTLYLWQLALDSLDLRIRSIVREELTAVEMRRFQRRLKVVARYQRSK